jgi:serine/threonine-protein kinase 24/25/MST4
MWYISNCSVLFCRSSGTVYKAQHVQTGYIVALKKIAVEDEDILQEIIILQNCKCDYIVKYYGRYFHDDYLWV